MRRPLAVILARLPFAFKRPFMIGIAAVLLVGLVGAAVWWQVGVHAAPARVSQTVVSAAGDPYSMSGSTGTAVDTVPNAGCTAVDSNGFCTGGVWTTVSPAIPGAQWIWPTVKWDPSTQGANPVTFTKQVSIPADALQIQGTILINADNGFDLQVNGHEVGSAHDLMHTQSYDITTLLRPGSNVITAEVTNDATPTDPFGNPGGFAFRADLSYTPDPNAPVTTASLAGTLGSNGWYRSPVTVTLHATDADSWDTGDTLVTTYSIDGAPWQTYSSSLTFSTDGVYSLRFRTVDQATNLEATQTQVVKIDQTSPVLNVSGAASQSYDACGTARPARPTYAPADAMSGLDGSEADSWTTPASATGAGVYTYTARAQDIAGNAASDTRTYKVLYGAAYSGLLDPYKADQANTANLNATLPLKFQLMCNGTPVTTAVASLSVKQGSGTAATTKPKKLSTANTFVYDQTSQTYQLNVSTGAGYTNPDSSVVTFAAGTWTFTVTLDDGTSYDYTIELR